MRNFYFKYFFLCLGPLGFAQIPKFPTMENPNPSTFQNYSDQKFTNLKIILFPQFSRTTTVLLNHTNRM
ncbi:hypothetical protein NAL32_21365 [Chryseobacterium sp. Ch-15]|uniref:Uncharacterized protein n=2 Tax=Chryseobacterium TaxID=59732 RepID=A0A9Q3V0S8_9FLAO|nr:MULTISPECIES: hypothetical protein [Chryseobacterium]KPE49035.1 hypothetical protein AOB46_22145 [Chryseobacterium indologenes]MCC9037110.1 hypothetical protein [Chryseobacterium muglaense]MCM2556943.1 hypothetical protein [Chryseobacterium muglaense]